VRPSKSKAALPIGRAARIACQIQAMRIQCCKAAQEIADRAPLNEAELEECARLDDSLADAQRLLKFTVKSIILSRLRRKSRAK